MSRCQQIIKRAVDLTGAVVGLILAVPVLLPIAAAIRLTMGTPVFFCQERPGLLGNPFWMYKFRTMRHAVNSQGNPLPDAERLTRLGKFLRRTSFDEFPELYNVLRGDMSLVGPRPLLMSYLNRYTPQQLRRHEVKPGITGWAQVNGRQTIRFSHRIELDVWYVEHQSLLLDFWILLITLPKAICGIGVRSGQDVGEVDDLPPPVTCSEAKR